MKTLAHFARTIGAVVLFAGCGTLQQAQGDMPPVGAPDAIRGMPATAAVQTMTRDGDARSSYRVVYNFGRSQYDALTPTASLIDVKGKLYSTTSFGGEYESPSCGSCGAVYSVTTTGKEHVLYSFRGRPDGYEPDASLIDVSGTLYGTTRKGGVYPQSAFQGGTVFSLTTTGKEQVLHSFGSSSDGAGPESSLINVNGTLYGTTSAGGIGNGTVYSISTAGTERVIYSFHGALNGSVPESTLIDVNGTLYGTTIYGGAHDLGTVFSVTTGGKERVVYSFRGVSDGTYPSGLVDAHGALYGTAGGGKNYKGLVFSVTTTGKEQVLHYFRGGHDGADPAASLIDVKGTLYGTTNYGGTYSKYNGGTVFSISTTGREHVLHSFGSGSDGFNPRASLVDVNGTLYGVTAGGGGANKFCSAGCGMVFALTP
jgi:uncharacterized repeat protein (TIGR03803 family)